MGSVTLLQRFNRSASADRSTDLIGHRGSRDATSNDAEGNDYEVRSLEEGEESFCRFCPLRDKNHVKIFLWSFFPKSCF